MAIPEMMRRGYHTSLALGTAAAGGTLGILIPPSIAMIIYGVITDTSIGHLFMAGIVPGILLALAVLGNNRDHALRNPSWAPPTLEGAYDGRKNCERSGASLPVIVSRRAGDRIDLFGRRDADRGRRGRGGRRALIALAPCAVCTDRVLHRSLQKTRPHHGDVPAAADRRLVQLLPPGAARHPAGDVGFSDRLPLCRPGRSW